MDVCEVDLQHAPICFKIHEHLLTACTMAYPQYIPKLTFVPELLAFQHSTIRHILRDEVQCRLIRTPFGKCKIRHIAAKKVLRALATTANTHIYKREAG